MNLTYEIEFDENCNDPRDWDNLGTIVCWHRRYNLGDDQPKQERAEWAAWFKKEHPNAPILPVYLYDHSGITISTSPFGCVWDSGQIGYIYATLESAQEAGFNWKRLNKNRRAILEKHLLGEIDTYDQFLRGEVYCFNILDEDGGFIDSVHGYYDREDCENEAKEALRYHEEELMQAA